MRIISNLIILLLAAYTVLVEPFVRTNFYRMLKKRLSTDPTARLLFYRTQVLWEWSWVVVLVVILIPVNKPLAWLGITMPNSIGWIIMLALLLGTGLSTVLLKRNPGALANMRKSLEATAVLLPSTPVERKWFAAVAITAGICEELLYRGFLIRFIMTTFPGLDWLITSILSGIIYGLSHAYQGRRGILQTTLNGFSFAIVFFISGNLLSSIGSTLAVTITGSLIPAMVFHAAAELRTLFLWQPVDKPKKKR
jgi:membrane protease YdiL (CAAX protease family)